MRITRQVMYMEMARAASKRSTCFRLNVGAIITQDNSPVSIGWNGAEAGAPHCAGNDCAGIVPGACGTIHAEVNAIGKAEGILCCDDGTIPAGPEWEPVKVDLYVTHSPCVECCVRLVSSWLTVARIFFEVPYRNTNHLEMLRRENIEVYEVTPAGYIVEYFSRKVVELP